MTARETRREFIGGEWFDVCVQSKTIVNPGRFEGEPRYVPRFWSDYLNGWADEDDGEVLTFNLNRDDKMLFPELRGRRTVRIRQSDQGYIEEIKE